MITRTAIKTGLALTVTAAVIAGGPAIAEGIGLGSQEPASFSAAWESEQQANARNASQSHSDVLEREAERKAKAKAEAKKKAAEKAKREAERKRKQAQAARAATRGGTPAQNRALGMAMCADMGWSSSQCADLGKLWQKESGWNHRADNPSSSAYGIPQALPGSKMGSAGSDWATNPATQIKWGLGYIKARYGNPSAAWAHSVNRGWY